MKKYFLFSLVLVAAATLTASGRQSMTDDGGKILALEKAWNRALAVKGAKALDMLPGSKATVVEIDGSVTTKK